jgi:hypothetical protein
MCRGGLIDMPIARLHIAYPKHKHQTNGEKKSALNILKRFWSRALFGLLPNILQSCSGDHLGHNETFFLCSIF